MYTNLILPPARERSVRLHWLAQDGDAGSTGRINRWQNFDPGGQGEFWKNDTQMIQTVCQISRNKRIAKMATKGEDMDAD